MTDETRFRAREDGWTPDHTAAYTGDIVMPRDLPQNLSGTVNNCRVGQLTATAYTIPTDLPEADGTFAWNSTTLVVVQATADGLTGTGWTYGAATIVPLIRHTLAPTVLTHPAMDIGGIWQDMVQALRNIGRPGLAAMALSAVDNALWDLKARLLGVPLHRLLGASRVRVPVYGSGGFTSYDQQQLTAQLQGWLEQGVAAVKIKIAESWGSNVRRDVDRVEQTLETVGPAVKVFVDANGGYTVGQAIRVGHTLDALGVTWFEEPVTSDDLTGLRAVRQATRLDVAAGEYADSLDYAHRMCAAGAVDCLQVDVTRCGGITELLRIAAVAAAHHLQISGHCSPYQHAPALAAISNLRHLEYFHDHARIEHELFTGTNPPHNGRLYLPETPGTGVDFNADRAAAYEVSS